MLAHEGSLRVQHRMLTRTERRSVARGASPSAPFLALLEAAEAGLAGLSPVKGAFVVMAATDAGALDDRAYREEQLAAGLVEGRLHLTAYALGASASV